MTIEYYRKNVFGKEVMYVSDPGQAKIIIKLTNKLTLTEDTMTALEMLGNKFEEVLAPRKEGIPMHKTHHLDQL